MTYEIYRYIFYGGLILSGLMLAVTVVLFFVLRIPNVIGDLTGANARKAIESIRNQNEQPGAKRHKPSTVNRERGKITDKMTPSGRLQRNITGGLGGHKTAKIGPQTDRVQAPPAAETTVLPSPAANETTVLETTVLAQPGGETTVLDQGRGANTNPVLNGNVQFAIEFEITYIHTNEVIV